MSFVSTHFTWNALNSHTEQCAACTLRFPWIQKSNLIATKQRREVACHLISFAHDTCHAAVWTPVCTASESTMWVPNGQVYCWAIGSPINQRSELTFSLASVWLMLIGQPEGQPGFDIQPRPSPDAISHSTHPFHNIHSNIDVIIDHKNIQKNQIKPKHHKNCKCSPTSLFIVTITKIFTSIEADLQLFCHFAKPTS